MVRRSVKKTRIRPDPKQWLITVQHETSMAERIVQCLSTGRLVHLPLRGQRYLQRLPRRGHLPLGLRGPRDPPPRADPATALHHQPGPPLLRQPQQLLDRVLLHRQPARRTQRPQKRKNH